MRIQTIHHNPMGDVLNECSAQGFRITTENGDVYDINTEGGMVTIQTRGCIINLESIPELLWMLNIKKPAAEAHCATCSCVSGMTPAVRFNTTPAEQDGAVRDHLIRMGWTPPAEAQAQGDWEANVTVRDGTWVGTYAEWCRRPRPAAVHRGAKTCYQCNRPVTWLAPDSRCGDCTRLTPDEVGG